MVSSTQQSFLSETRSSAQMSFFQCSHVTQMVWYPSSIDRGYVSGHITMAESWFVHLFRIKGLPPILHTHRSTPPVPAVGDVDG